MFRKVNITELNGAERIVSVSWTICYNENDSVDIRKLYIGYPAYDIVNELMDRFQLDLDFFETFIDEFRADGEFYNEDAGSVIFKDLLINNVSINTIQLLADVKGLSLGHEINMKDVTVYFWGYKR